MSLLNYRASFLYCGILTGLLAFGLTPLASAQKPEPAATATARPVIEAIPATWQEHWFEHNQFLDRVAHNKDVAIYFDKDVPASASEWILPFMTKLWQYTKKTYGAFGKENRLYSVFHQGKYSGGHPSTYFDASHDYRDVSDCGPGPWNQPAYDIPSHEVAHIVEGSSNGVHGSPAFGLWGDSKWAEFYQYDAYVALKMPQEAQRLFDRFTRQKQNFPRADTYWFRDWFYPLWNEHGHARVMAKFFQLTAKYFPKSQETKDDGVSYARDMNWGEYIHFMSGAAGTDLKPLATRAFGWPAEWEGMYAKARVEFPKIKY